MTHDRHRGAVLTVLCTVLFVTFLDNTVVSVTLANIQGQLHAGVQTLRWVVNGYALAFACLMLAGGMLGDLFGRKRVMIGGLGVFCAGSVVAAVAPGAGVLLVGRVLMGVGAAGSEPGTLSVIRHVYTDRGERARALGVWAAVSGVALAMGPVIAGVLVGLWDWRGVFWFNLFLGAVAITAAARLVPESADPEGASLDVPGIALGATALAAGIFAVIQGEQTGYGTWWILALFVLSVVAGVAFVVVELRSERPVLDPRLFRRARFAVPNLVAFTTYFGIFSIFFFVALYLQLLANQSPFSTALDFVPMTVVMITASALTGRWVARAGPKVPMTVGCVLAGAGLLIVDGVLGPHVGFADLSWSLALAGAGFGIALVPVTSAALGAVPADRSGMAASTTNTSRELGAVFGVAILGAVVNAQLTSNLTSRLNALGIPANFQSVVMQAVTHGGVPANAQQAAQQNPPAANAGPIVQKVLDAAERAFYSGLHQALLVSACLLLASAVVAWFAFSHAAERRRASGEATSGAREWLVPAALVVLVVGAAIGAEAALGGGGTVTASAPTSTTTSTSAPAAPGSGGTATSAPSGPTVTVSPSSGLADGQAVTVTGHGFPAGSSLVAVECAKGSSVGPGDCALTHLANLTAGPHGNASTTLTVQVGTIGSAKKACGPSHPCQIAISQPRQGGASATATIRFGG